MSGYTVIVCNNGTQNYYYTEMDTSITLVGKNEADAGPFYYGTYDEPTRKVVEVFFSSSDGKGDIKFVYYEGPNEKPVPVVGKTNAVTLYVANRAEGAGFDAANNVLTADVPIPGGEVGWDFKRIITASASLILKVRVKHL